jgi:diguanylate cyclase (GGDEF)-like protein
MDGLTGILTRSAFIEDLETTSQHGVPGALLFLDLDYFKSINDRYGHATGDEALRCAGRILARYQGQSDFAGRLGGEEFGLFQRDLAFDEMFDRCEEAREEIARIVLQAPCGSQVRISASIGAFYCPSGFDPSGCLKAADENLYRAKALGRNRVVAWPLVVSWDLRSRALGSSCRSLTPASVPLARGRTEDPAHSRERDALPDRQ